MKLIRLALLFCTLLSLSPTSLAWGAAGHQIIGAIADQLLRGTQAELHIRQLLDGATLEQVSVWADCVKGVDPEQNFAYVPEHQFAECRRFENLDGIAAMRDFAQRNHHNCPAQAHQETCHKHYHYSDIPIAVAHYQDGQIGSTPTDLLHASAAALKTLQQQTPPAPFHFKNQREALMLLTHLVGDLHQPLHVAAIYLQADGSRVNPHTEQEAHKSHTLGGNLLTVGDSNLHAMWDKVPAALKHGKIRPDLFQQAKALRRESGNTDVLLALWADAALQDGRAAFEGIHFQAQQEHHWPMILPNDYSDRMQRLQEAELVRAGAHLAQLLQIIFPDTHH